MLIIIVLCILLYLLSSLQALLDTNVKSPYKITYNCVFLIVFVNYIYN